MNQNILTFTEKDNHMMEYNEKMIRSFEGIFKELKLSHNLTK